MATTGHCVDFNVDQCASHMIHIKINIDVEMSEKGGDYLGRFILPSSYSSLGRDLFSSNDMPSSSFPSGPQTAASQVF